MRTEMANLPGKCLREHRRQFKLSVGTLAQDFFFTVTSTSVFILVVQATVKHQMFSGDTPGHQTFSILAALKTRTIAEHTCLCRHTVDYAAH